MKRFISLALILITVMGCAVGCSSDKSQSESGGKSETVSENTESQSENSETSETASESVIKTGYVLAPTSFDGKLIDYIGKRFENENHMISPLSLRYALGLLLPGADGQTKTELMTALGIENEDEWENVCRVFNGFIQKYQDGVADEKDEFERNIKLGYIGENAVLTERGISVANSIWKREDIGQDFEEAYENKINAVYSAEYKLFNEDNAVQNINAWADEKTKGMIQKLLPDDYDTADLAVILMNALYFKDAWVNAFSKSETEEKDFNTADGKKVKKSFMTQTEDFLYYGDGETELVIIPMKGDVYMAFVIGDTSDIAAKTANATEKRVKVTIPKIELETTFSNGELSDFLKTNGVNLAFTLDADFSNMIDHQIYISDIIQKTKIKLDEDGVEAAAVTAIIMKENCAPHYTEKPIEFTADKPFSFYIYTTVNDITEIMFAGYIAK